MFSLNSFFLFFLVIHKINITIFISIKRMNEYEVIEIAGWVRRLWIKQFEKENFDSLKRKILTVWKGKIRQFEKENFDSLKRKISAVWKGKFWQFEKENFDSLKRKILTVWKRKISTISLMTIQLKFTRSSKIHQRTPHPKFSLKCAIYDE
jgi:hypothetical protein